MERDQDRLDRLLSRLTPEIAEGFAIERRIGQRLEQEEKSYERMAKGVVASVFQEVLGNSKLIQVVNLFGEEVHLLDTPEITGGKWYRFEMGRGRTLYSIRRNQGGVGEKTRTTPEEAGTTYVNADYSLRTSKPPIEAFRISLEGEVINNITRYIESIEEKLKE